MQRVESAKLQVRDFHNKKCNISNYTSGQTNKGDPLSKKEKGMGGVEIPSTQKGTQNREGPNGWNQLRGTPSSGSAVTPQVNCSYCSKSNYSENYCWRKSGRCLFCGSVKYQLATCPNKQKVGGNT
mgnify:CR=1 FL=1